MQKSSIWLDFWQFLCCLGRYGTLRLAKIISFFETGKSGIATKLYHQRGRYSRPFMHSGMAFLVVGGITLGPVLIAENLSNPWKQIEAAPMTLTSVENTGDETTTQISAKPRSEVVEYEVQSGDTVSTIAEKFGISVDTIRWENNLTSIKDIKLGQKLRILPVTGILHKVTYGETIYTIAKKYQVDAQVIVDWPYNSFANDETFALATGQTLIVPDGVKPKEVPTIPRIYYAQTPTAGTITGTGQFVWPTQGQMTQFFSWYHKAIDVANHAAPPVIAADSGTVIVAGWPSNDGYGNRIMINHGNGYVTLYGHLQQIYVTAGEKVVRGQTIGKMGSTGRSTGTHLHFEIRVNGACQNPLAYLK